MTRFALPTRRIGAALALAASAAMSLAGPTLAAQPYTEVIDIGTPDIEAAIAAFQSDACGFAISVDADATITVRVFSNNDGTFRREIDQVHLDWTLTNVETGATVRILSVGPDIYWTSHDGAPLHASVGIILSESGQWIGRLLYDDVSGDLLRASGRSAGDADAVFCDPIAP
jgi:hypothetical protein